MGGRHSRRWARILVISDESQLLRLVRSILRPLHFSLAELFFLGKDAVSRDDADIVIIDVEHFSADVVREVRQHFPAAEVIALSRAYSESDAILALEMGVEFLARPFRSQDLVMRVHAAELRRLTALGYKQYYSLGSLILDTLARRVTRGGRVVPITSAELTVLALLVREPGRLVTFEEILTALGRRIAPDRRQGVRVLMVGLRHKLEADPEQPISIENDSRMGYRLTLPANSAPT